MFGCDAQQKMIAKLTKEAKNCFWNLSRFNNRDQTGNYARQNHFRVQMLVFTWIAVVFDQPCWFGGDK
jgi:hypothetical protein